MAGVLPNSTVSATVAVGGDELQASVLDTAVRAAAHVLRCGSIAVRWNTPGVLQAPENVQVFSGVRRSVLHSLGLSGDNAGAHPPIEISPKDFLLSDHSNRGRDRYEMVVPFGAHHPSRGHNCRALTGACGLTPLQPALWLKSCGAPRH